MESLGASATWTKKILSALKASMGAVSQSRERMWKESRQVPRFGWSTVSTKRWACS